MNLFYFFIHHLGHFLPRPVAEFITCRIADLASVILYREGMKNYTKNIEPILGRFASPRERFEWGVKGVRNFAIFVYEFLLVPRLKWWNFKRFMFPVNFERARDTFKKGKGVIILTAHIGNYEWGAVLLRLLGYPLSVVTIPFINDYVRNFYEKKRRAQGIEVIYTGKASIGSIKALRKGRMVAIVGDRVFSEDGLEVEMFGRKTLFPKGPFYLSHITGAPVVPAFAIKERDGKYHVYFEKEMELNYEMDREEFVKEGVKKWAKIMERYLRKYPDQWHRFDIVWKE